MSDVEFRPLTGDPALLERKARHYQQIAEAIERSTRTLKSIEDGVDKSLSTAELAKQAVDVRKDIAKAKDRYSQTAAALLTYASALRAAQDDARNAMAVIDAKQSAYDAAVSQSIHADAHARDTRWKEGATLEDKTRAVEDADRARRHVNSAHSELEAAHQRWRDALSAKTHAARTAVNAISDVVDRHNHGLEDPSWWEKALQGAYEALKKICEVAAFLSIFLAWVPGLGEVLMVLAAVGAVLMAIEAIYKAATGQGTWLDAGFAVVGAVLSIFGGKLLDMAITGVRGMAVTRGLTALTKVARRETSGGAIGGMVSASMRKIQGAPGVMGYMTKVAAKDAEGALQRALTSPQGFREAFKEAFKKSFSSEYVNALAQKGWKAGMAENAERFMTELKGVGQRDLLQTWKTIAGANLGGDAQLVHAALGVTALKIGQIGVEAYNGFGADGSMGDKVFGAIEGGGKNLLPEIFGHLADRGMLIPEILSPPDMDRFTVPETSGSGAA